FLISKADPFIVLPGFMLRDKSLPFCPRIGDYAAVIFRDKIYPAVFGDVGPSVKVGEASVRIAKALNLKATAYNRPTNHLDVSYLVFPQSADATAAPPDYEKWRARCVELLADLGATNVNVERWENILPPMPTPTPTPDPAAAIPLPKPLAAPTGTPSPASSATPGASVTPTPSPTSKPVTTATPSPSATPKPSATPSPSAAPKPSPSPSPSVTPTPSASPTPSATPRPSATP
ncbi:MAG TPA: glycoside hydrolase family 75 protein, partial [Chthoniobacterales bacterium]